MRQNSTLGIIIALLVALALGVGAYLYITSQDTKTGTGEELLPTPIPEPDIQILSAASDIPANRLISSADFESLFQIDEVPPSQVTPNDVRADEFSTVIQGKVTTAAVRGGDRIKKDFFRPAGIAELIPTPAPGQSARKAISLFVTDLGNIAAQGNTVDIVASYSLEQPYLRVTGSTFQAEVPGGTVLTVIDEKYLDTSTHVIAQNIPVLKVLEPVLTTPDGQPVQQAPAAETVPTVDDGTGGVGQPQPTTAPVFSQGAQWTVILAVTDQEAELIEYSKNRLGSVINLIVRRADDGEQVTTTGVTMDLLMRLYGVPQVYAQPNILVDLLDAPPPPQPPSQPPVVIPVQPFGQGAPQPLPTTAPAATATPAP